MSDLHSWCSGSNAFGPAGKNRRIIATHPGQPDSSAGRLWPVGRQQTRFTLCSSVHRCTRSRIETGSWQVPVLWQKRWSLSKAAHAYRSFEGSQLLSPLLSTLFVASRTRRLTGQVVHGGVEEERRWQRLRRGLLGRMRGSKAMTADTPLLSRANERLQPLCLTGQDLLKTVC